MFSGQYTALELDDLAAPIVTLAIGRGLFGREGTRCRRCNRQLSTGLLPRAPARSS